MRSGKLVFKFHQARLNYQARIGADVSIQDLADAVGVSRSHMSNVEGGKMRPSWALLERLCQFYGVDVEELVEFQES